MRHLLPIITLLLAAALASCTQPQDPKHVTFACDGGATFAVSFADRSATMEAGGRTYALTQQVAGSGIHYAGEGQDLRGKGPDMTWTDASGTRQCRDQEWAMRQPQIQPPVQPSGRALAGTSWTLVHFQSSDDAIGTRVPPNLDRYRLQFQADGNLALQLDCNRAMGRWTAAPSTTGGTLTLTGGAMTRAFCGPGALDTQIARDLPRIRSYTYAGMNLSLALEADSGTYLWGPANPDER